MPAFHELLHDALPRLTPANHRISSPGTWEYNCIAWAVGRTDAWWWPVPGRYWPPNVPREETLASFVAALVTLGYVPCADAHVEPGAQKIALYARDGVPTHSSRQLADGWWTSKMGPSVDIEHATPDEVAGDVYGDVVMIFSRPAGQETSL
jgi:hypothetical protein